MCQIVDATDGNGKVFSIMEAEASREAGNGEAVSGASGGWTAAAAGVKVARKGEGKGKSSGMTPVMGVNSSRRNIETELFDEYLRSEISKKYCNNNFVGKQRGRISPKLRNLGDSEPT